MSCNYEIGVIIWNKVHCERGTSRADLLQASRITHISKTSSELLMTEQQEYGGGGVLPDSQTCKQKLAVVSKAGREVALAVFSDE